ncbi:MAG: HAMP domain-containing protein [Pirellulaceae bacterium]|nr:HAMP domain-containing protein [Pirellulaceae bacterium]
MGRSIRWTMLGWYGLILLLVVGGLGSILYWHVRQGVWRNVESQLVREAQLLAAGLMEAEAKAKERGKKPKPERFSAGDDSVPPPIGDDALILSGPLQQEVIPGKYLHPFRGKDVRDDFAIWKGKDSPVLLVSGTKQAIPPPDPMRHRGRPLEEYTARRRGNRYEIILTGPSSTDIMVGRNISKELSELRTFLATLLGGGAGVIVVGLIGGWFLSLSVLRPIQRMTETASSISASNLSQRIDLAETKSELGELAGVLNAMFARLDAAFERQTRFTADAAHELRTPLAVVLAHSELALQAKRTGEEYREALVACQRAAARMKRLTDDLLTLSRDDAANLATHRALCNLREIVETCRNTLLPLAAPARISVDARLDSVQVWGDPERLAELVANLLSNAIVYNRPDGAVEVRLADDGTCAVLTVSDTGIGIDPEDQPLVFDRFFRCDRARSRVQGGNGLGLAICKEIVGAHGGEISLASTPDVGTTVTIRLPRHGLGPSEAAEIDAQQQRIVTGGPA